MTGVGQPPSNALALTVVIAGIAVCPQQTFIPREGGRLSACPCIELAEYRRHMMIHGLR
jgi:hypothetical protein